MALSSLRSVLFVLRRSSERYRSVVSSSSVMKFASTSAIEEAQVVVDGQVINYVKTGRGRRTVFCMPGALGSWKTDFSAQLDKLDKEKLTVIVWDPPGYGKSRPPDRDFSPGFFERDANLAAKFIEKISITPCSVFGWSDGGITALILAYQLRDSKQIDRLLVWGANSYVTKDECATYESIRNIDNWSPKMRQPFIAANGEKYFRNKFSEWVDAFKSIEAATSDGNICKHLLKYISQETLIVHGAKDPLVPGFHAKCLREGIPHSKLIVHPDGKHNVHVRYADWFNSIATDFVENGLESVQEERARYSKL